MYENILNRVESALDEYAAKLPNESLTFQSIIREDDWTHIAFVARGEGFSGLANLLDTATVQSVAIN